MIFDRYHSQPYLHIFFLFLITLSIITYTKSFYLKSNRDQKYGVWKNETQRYAGMSAWIRTIPEKYQYFFFMKNCNNKMVTRLNIMITYITFAMIWIAIAYSKCSATYCACSFTCCILAWRDVAIQYQILFFSVIDNIWKDERCCLIAYTSLPIIFDHLASEIKRFVGNYYLNR